MNDELFELAMTAPGEWAGCGRTRFQHARGTQFGGYLNGLLLAAILREPERLGVPVAQTGVLVASVAAAPLKIKTARLRAGKSLEFWQAEIVQDEKLCAQATVTLAQRPQSGSSFGWIEMPTVADPESLPRAQSDGASGASAIYDSTDRRGVRGLPPEKPEDGISWIWTKVNDNHPIDYPRLAMVADMFAPRAFYGTDKLSGASTVSFSTYFHAPEEEVAKVGRDYLLLEGRGRRGSYGICDLTGALWRRDGLLLATTEQLCWFR